MKTLTRRPPVVLDVIRNIAQHAEQFTWQNLTPALSHDQAVDGCKALVKKGELRVVRPAGVGRYGGAAVYERVLPCL